MSFQNSAKLYDLVVIGELNVDLIITGDDILPEFGQREKLVDDASLVPGSSSAIFACQASKLGLKTAFIGKVGDDDFGRFMVHNLASSGVDTSAIIVDKTVKTGITIHLSCAQDRAMLTYPGSVAALKAQEIDLSLFERARHLHVASFFLQAGIKDDLPAILIEAKRKGLTTSLDTGWDPAKVWNGPLQRALKYIEVFLPNENEALNITGKADVRTALLELTRCIPIVVIKLGAAGAIAKAGDQVVRMEAFPIEVIDATGAGDSFDAGFIYGYLKGLPLAESLQIGCACGALSTMRIGGVAGQPTLEELKEFLGKGKLGSLKGAR